MSEVKVERRMDAYYYGFEPTGVDAVDVVLSAVACAGKAFHNTSDWGDDCEFTYNPEHRGANPVEWIQNAANDAAEAMQQMADHSAAIAAARAEGYAKCQADVVAWCRKRKLVRTQGGGEAAWEHVRDRIADSIEAGVHIGASDSVSSGQEGE